MIIALIKKLTVDEVLLCLKKLSKIYIYNSSDTLLCGESRPIKVVGIDQNNKEIQLNDDKIEWIINGGSIHQGIFTAGNHEGTFEIKAKVGIFEACTTIKIIEPPRASKLSISHHQIKLEFGQVQKITGVVLDQRDSPMLQATIKWEVKGGGKIGEDGSFQAGYEAGVFEIHASHGSLRQIISVNVIEPPSLQQIVISSLVNKLEYNQKLQLYVKGIDQYGNDIKILNVDWSASSGKINKYGIFDAGNQEGIIVIKATSENISAYTEVEVREPSRLAELKISPTDINLIPGEEAIFCVTAFNQYGEEVSSEGINWTTTGAIVSQSGCFRAEDNQKGCYEVTATLDNYSATATVHISSILKRIEISPNQIELKPEEENLFTVTGFDQTNTVIPIEGVQWKTTAGGSITQNGLFKRNDKHYEVTITANVKNFNATAKVILLTVLKRIEIIPSFVYLKPGEIYWKTTSAKIEQNGILTVSSSDQGYIQVTATSKLTPKYSQDVKNLFFYTGVFSRIISWLISNETLLENLLSSDLEQKEFDCNANLDVDTDTNQDIEQEEFDAKIDISFDINKEVDNIVESEESIERDNDILVEANDDIDILEFNTALERWLFRKIVKKVASIFVSISHVCFDEVSTKLSAYANVFVLAIEYNSSRYCLKFLRHMYAHSELITSLFVSSDGQKLFSISLDNTIKIWNIETGCIIKKMNYYNQDIDYMNFIRVNTLKITEDGKKLIASDDNKINTLTHLA